MKWQVNYIEKHEKERLSPTLSVTGGLWYIVVPPRVTTEKPVGMPSKIISNPRSLP